MMLQRKKSSESDSKRRSFGDKGDAEGRDYVRFCRVRLEVTSVLDGCRWWYKLEIQVRWILRCNSRRRHDGQTGLCVVFQ